MSKKSSRQLIIDDKDCPKCQEDIKEETKGETTKEIISIMSHEIRNPVMLIGGFTERVINKLKEGKENQDGYVCYGKEQIQKIISYNEIMGIEMKHLESILNTINDFITIDKLQPEKVDLHTLLNKIIETVSDNRVQFLMQYELKEEPILDPVKIKMLMLNILINAKEAILEERKHHYPDNNYRGRIEIIVGVNSANENLFDIVISNNGVLISKEDLPKIFDQFFTTKKGGQGIGLAVSKKIIKAHKGKISVECEPVTKFTITLPKK